VPFSHYPKTVTNIVFAWVQPAPPDVEHKNGTPNFLGQSFSKTNRFRESLVPGSSVFGYHDAQPFTRFYGSVACDQPLAVSLSFSNDEVDAEGNYIGDHNIRSLHYDAFGAQQLYDPRKQEQTGKIFSMIFGRWIRVEAKNLGDEDPSFIRLYVRGSVF
jgi:hypothetical protein